MACLNTCVYMRVLEWEGVCRALICCQVDLSVQLQLENQCPTSMWNASWMQCFVCLICTRSTLLKSERSVRIITPRTESKMRARVARCTPCALQNASFLCTAECTLRCVESFLLRPGVNIRPKWSDHKWTAPGKVRMHSRCTDTHSECEGVWTELMRRVILAVGTGTCPWPQWRTAYSSDKKKKPQQQAIVIQIPSYQFNGEFRKRSGLRFNNSENGSLFKGRLGIVWLQFSGSFSRNRQHAAHLHSI